MKKIKRQIFTNIQWLGLCTSTAGGTSSSPGQELRYHMLHGMTGWVGGAEKESKNIPIEPKGIKIIYF